MPPLLKPPSPAPCNLRQNHRPQPHRRKAGSASRQTWPYNWDTKPATTSNQHQRNCITMALPALSIDRRDGTYTAQTQVDDPNATLVQGLLERPGAKLLATSSLRQRWPTSMGTAWTSTSTLHGGDCSRTTSRPKPDSSLVLGRSTATVPPASTLRTIRGPPVRLLVSTSHRR